MRAAILALALMLPAGAAAADCGLAVKVVAERVSAAVAIDKALSSFELSRDYAARHPEDPGLHLLGGETVIDRRIEYHYEPAAAIALGDDACLQPPTIRIRIEDVSRKVRVAREFAADACLEREVLAHETRHVRASQDTTDAAIAGAQRSFDAFVAARRGRADAGVTDSSRALASTAVAWVTAWQSQLGDAIARENALIDSPEEYRRFPTVCDGRGGALAAQTLARLTGQTVAATSASPVRRPPQLLSAMPPDAPVFAGAIDPIAAPVELRQRPFGERALVQVTLTRRVVDGAPATARLVVVGWIKAEPNGRDVVHSLRIDRVDGEGLAPPRNTRVRMVVAEHGRPVEIGVDTPPEARGHDPARTAAQSDMAVAMASIRSWVPDELAGVLRTGDVINLERRDDGTRRSEHRTTVRGLATHQGRRVIVTDSVSLLSRPDYARAAHGYDLIDPATGVAIFSDENVVELAAAGGRTVRTESQTVRTLSETVVGQAGAAPPSR